MATTISVIQMTSSASWPTNAATLASLFSELPVTRPQLVLIPEAFSHFNAGESQLGRYAEEIGSGDVQTVIAKLAAQHGVWVVAGTIPIKAGERYAAASLLFDDTGKQVARYDKIHLFDAAVADNTKRYEESAYTVAGNNIVVVDTPFGRLGMAVCYDLRFPELFRVLRAHGAELISLPSAFTKVTGAAHWLPLLQARAIENQVYMLAPNQWGKHNDGRETWGQSMIVDPWGEVIAQQYEGVGIISAQLDMKLLKAVRASMPVAQHNRFEVTFLE